MFILAVLHSVANVEMATKHRRHQACLILAHLGRLLYLVPMTLPKAAEKPYPTQESEPVERVDGSPQLGLPSDLFSKPKALGAADFFWAWCAGCPKPCSCPVSLGLACKKVAFRLGLQWGGVSLGSAGSASPASLGLPCCHEFVFFCRY